MTVAAHRRAGGTRITTADGLEAALRTSRRVHGLKMRSAGASFVYRRGLWPLLQSTCVDVRLVGTGTVDIEVQSLRFSLGDAFNRYARVADAVEEILN